MRRLKLNLSRLLPALPLLGLAVFAPQAFAQAPASCSIQAETPTVITGTTHTLAPADGCGFLVFTSGSSIAITMPNAATTLPAGFKVFIKAQGAGTVTLNTPTTSTIDGAVGTVAITQGTGVSVRSDGTNYYTSGLGIKHP